MTEYSFLGKSLPRLDAAGKLTGKAQYVADLNIPGMLHGVILRSPYAHARIRRLDVSKACALPGVVAVITAADIPASAGRAIMAEDKVLYGSHPVAAVAAVTREIAEAALGCIEVEYEPLPVVSDGVEAMKPDAPLLHPNLYTESMTGKASTPSNIANFTEFRRGDVEAGFAQAAVVREDTYRTQMIHHGYLEPQACVAQVDSGGKVTIWASVQGAFTFREQLGASLGLPLSRIRVVPMEVGGGFGGKNGMLLGPLCVLLAQKAGRPVRMVMTREEDLRMARPAPPTTITVKLGATREGLLTAAEVTMVYEAGAFASPLPPSGFVTGLSPYCLPNVKVNGYVVVVNKPPVGALRAPGAPQAAFAVECQMDQMAEALGMDPLQFRFKNIVTQGDRALNDLTYARIGFQEVLEKVAQHPNWVRPLEGKYRGRGLACGMWFGGVGSSAATLNINADGTFALLVGSVDLTGTRTIFVQIVAEELGVSPDEVSVVMGDTDTAPYADIAAGSRTTRQMGAAVQQACHDAKAELIRRGAASLGVAEGEVEYRDRRVQMKGHPEKFVSLRDLARASISTAAGPIVGRGASTRPSPAPSLAAHVVDVEVDPETGKVTVLSYTAVQDVGFAINPTMVEGQIQGAVAMGAGWALSEDYIFEDGILQNASLMDYHQPTAADLPMIDTAIVEVPSDNPYGVRGVGEPPIVPSLAAIANAIHKATGVRMSKLPMTSEAVWRAIRAQAKG
ncbi:MAG: xanthine dehydrogenase family protein molybdopterin-binding subunit [Chloroflexi bacterium]|nr:xanthine dehydrogenase family protein molybdopterin-binding subunit [Chloroflexota bacterium]